VPIRSTRPAAPCLGPRTPHPPVLVTDPSLPPSRAFQGRNRRLAGAPKSAGAALAGLARLASCPLTVQVPAMVEEVQEDSLLCSIYPPANPCWRLALSGQAGQQWLAACMPRCGENGFTHQPGSAPIDPHPTRCNVWFSPGGLQPTGTLSKPLFVFIFRQSRPSVFAPRRATGFCFPYTPSPFNSPLLRHTPERGGVDLGSTWISSPHWTQPSLASAWPEMANGLARLNRSANAIKGGPRQAAGLAGFLQSPRTNSGDGAEQCCSAAF